MVTSLPALETRRNAQQKFYIGKQRRFHDSIFLHLAQPWAGVGRSECLFPAVAVTSSKSGSGLPKNKFLANGVCQPFMFCGGKDGLVPLTERVIPAAVDNPGAALIQPTRLLQQLFFRMLNSDGVCSLKTEPHVIVF